MRKIFTTPPRRISTRQANQHHESGVILPITLILLLVLITAGVVAARNASISERVSNNLRTSNVAFQAAELGIRYCESLVINVVEQEGSGFSAANVAKIPKDTLTITSPSDGAASWKTLTNWTSTTAIVVPKDYYAPTNTNVSSGIQLSNAPLCIVERLPSSTNERFLITARGRSNDSKIDATTSRLTQGAEVWLQSTLKPSGV
jgi:type IV pilus assembly protein PilX